MKFRYLTLLYLPFLGLSSFGLKAQDSLRLFQKLEHQYSRERQLLPQFYHTPASRLGYGKFSFSDLNIGYENEEKKIYRQQEGSGEKNLSIKVNSFQKTNENRSIWGNTGYQNMKLKSVKWNENLDYDRIAPYTIADSVGGDTKLERYSFGGGISQKLNRWTLGLSADYTAQLGSRDRDPRQKSTTSDLYINLGANYRFYKDYEIGVFGQINKYTQNTSISFVSELGQALMYQMTGFGFSNYFFNGGSPAAIYEEFGYKTGAQVFRHSKNPFYLTGSLSQAQNLKSVNPSNRYFDISDLDKTIYEVEGAKFFNINQHRLGAVAQYQAHIFTGAEYGYTNNTQIIEPLYKRKSYKKEDYQTTVKLMYQYQADRFVAGVVPVFQYQEFTEKRKYPFSGQKFTAYTLGLETFYKQEIAKSQMLSLSAHVSQKHIKSGVNAINTDIKSNIVDWLMQDYQYLTSGYLQMGASLRYDIQLEKFPAFYVQGNWSRTRIQEKNNNFTQIILGITF